MTLLHRLASIVRWITHRNRAERDLNDELEAFVDVAAAEKIRDGAPADEARRLAVLQLGGVEQAKERVRKGRHGAWLDEAARDVRYALRTCARNPGFSTVVLVTLALGIGANTAVFSVIDAVLLRPMTYTEPERLVVVHETLPDRGRIPVGAVEFEEWRRAAKSFEQMALMAVAPVILTGSGDPERLDAARVSPSLFPMLGIDAALGRTFTPDEEVLGRHRVVVLSDAVWRTRFGADPSIVGRTITLNDEPYVVSGVLPERFRFPRLEQVFVMGVSGNRPQLWMPFAITDAERGENSFAAVAKLKRGVSMDQGRAEVSAILNRLVQQSPNGPQLGTEVIPLQEQIVGSSRDVLMLVWAAITAVLLVACANIANLFLARSAVRSHELAIRGALGASRGTLIRHSLLDTMTLALMGGLGGVFLARWSLPFLVGLAPANVPRLEEVAVDERAILFTALITTTSGLVVGLLPARRAAGINVIEGLRVTARSSTVSRHDRTARSLMVTMQIALTVACLRGPSDDTRSGCASRR
jgi:predicted permease